eukprot:1159509-Pelagomonas_calceolata.AAC.3
MRLSQIAAPIMFQNVVGFANCMISMAYVGGIGAVVGMDWPQQHLPSCQQTRSLFLPCNFVSELLYAAACCNWQFCPMYFWLDNNQCIQN